MPANTNTHDRPANRLAREASPYLLQHAHNPVDWRPWGREAFDEARRRDVPIFLSIGYATCYWCHVMERESFESDEIAQMLNERFVCIKVDREEHPEVDEVYMAATVMMTGHGGWPMSVFLEPAHLRPFWCGTYFPPEPRHSMPSFKQVIEGMGEAWRTQRDDVLEQADRLAAAVAEQLGAQHEPVTLNAGHVQRAVSDLLRIADQTHGGFGRAPKFPQPVFTEFLLDVREALDSATRVGVDTVVGLTLDRMARGGMRDQLGGSFHRYSVDAHWVVPHFEKMLYDNGQLASLYARAATLLSNPACARTTRQVLDDTLREMRLDCCAFASAQDAEVDGREGLNYLWTPEQIDQALDDPDDAEFIKTVYALDRGTNFQDPHHPDDPPANVLHMIDTAENLADRAGMTTEVFLQRVDRINQTLLDARSQRPAPATDDKVIAAWNGLMIAGFVAGAEVLDEPRYAQAAADAADFILREMVTEDGRLHRTWRNGSRGVDGVLEDHAAMIHALLALHNTRHLKQDQSDTAPSKHLDAAVRLLDQARTRFADPQTGGYFDTDADREDLFVRTRATHDGPIPSPASMMIHNLIDMADATGESRFLEEAMHALSAVSHAVNESPVGALHSTRALLRLLRRHDAPRNPQIIDAATPDPVSARDDAPSQGQFTPVEVFADAERLEVGPGAPAAMQVFIRIAPGYHIVAADPGDQDSPLVPLRVHTVGGSGLAVYADYPPGEPYEAAPQGLGRPMVYTGEFEFTVAVEQDGESSGRPLLALTYQACTDTECQLPTTVELDVAVDSA